MPVVDSPLRYPGGKSELIPFMERVVKENKVNVFVEPFAGGASVGLSLLLKNKIPCLFLNDLDKGIYALFYSILNETNELVELIDETPISMEVWRKSKETYLNGEGSLVELGFSTLFLNRVNYSGILSA